MAFHPNNEIGCCKYNSVFKKPEIQIDITANANHCGRTTIAAIIACVLEEAGFKDIVVNCDDGDINDVPSIDINDINAEKIDDIVKETKIIINDLIRR